MLIEQQTPGSGVEIPDEQQCRALVERILASKCFQRANRLRDFLRYISDRKFAGTPQEVTEVLIGQRVFGRAATYNPGEDSIVRTEARNLRQRLERYFGDEGSAETILLEIPRGGYLPVFRWKAEPVQESPSPSQKISRRKFWLGGAAAAGAGVAAAGWFYSRRPSTSQTREKNEASHPIGMVDLDSSDARLVRNFRGAKQRAMGYVYTGDPVGDWYDSTAGNRYAFCMRDVSHQSTGAAVLGLTGHTRNMLRRFAESISSQRDWCGFWEINKDGFPSPMDYKDDADFWYCLPANFDLLQACYRQFLWTNDSSYFDASFSNFYDRTVTSYVEAWDRDHDGVIESPMKPRRRGMGSYYQEDPLAMVGADMLAAQYTGYLAYAAIQELKGGVGSLSSKLAAQYREKANALRIRYNTEWWNPQMGRYYSAILPNRKFNPEYVADSNAFALLFGLSEEGLKTEASLDALEKIKPPFNQTRSYFPEILYRYGRNESAYQFLLELTDAEFKARGMPEISFAAVGVTATGLMGISADAPHNAVESCPRLPKDVERVKLSHVPILGNEISVLHRGLTDTTLTNESGPLIQWRINFPVQGNSKVVAIFVDGVSITTTLERRANQQYVASAVVPIQPGESRNAKLQ